MANLSNINGKFVVEQTTGYVGIGITDPSQLLHLQSAADTILKIDNITSGTGKSYLLQSTTAGSFVIRDEDASSNRLLIDTSGNATFAGDVTVTGGDLTLGTDSIASNINAVGDVLGINVDSNTGGGAGANIQLKTAGTTQLTINNSSSTFAGNISVTGTSFLDGDVTIGDTNSAFIGMARAGANYIAATNASGELIFRTAGSTPALTLDTNQNATFASAVWIPDYIYHVGDANSKFGFPGNDTFVINTSGTTALTIDASRNATFTATVTAPTFSGDLNGTINTVTTATTKGNSTNDTTVATTAFVQNVIGTIPAGLVFQGTWNASTNSPTLTSGSGTTGNFYIVSVAGSTNLDGITDWQVGDWAVFIEQGASDQWEKIDNSSVLSGSGTGGSFAGWSGSGTSVTLGNAPVTFSGNNSTFAGDINLAAGKKLQYSANSFMTPENNTSGAEISTAGTFIVKTGTTPTLALTLGGTQNATFAGDVIIGQNASPELTIKKTNAGTGTVRFQNDGSNTSYIQLDAYEHMVYYGGSGVGHYFYAGTVLNETKLGANSTFAGNVTLSKAVGDTELLVEADTNNDNENYNPRLHLRQDGGAISAYFGLNGDVDNTFTGALANGAYIRAAGSIQFANGSGTDLAMTIDTSQKVGIGTTSPDRKLHVDSGSTNIVATFESSDATAAISLKDNSTTNDSKVQIRAIGDDFNIVAGGSQRVTVNSSGNVGIGTTSPDLGAVAGTTVLTIASPTAERWGILELAGNRTWGGNQVGELKFISTDSTNNGTLVSLTALNDPTATGTGGSLKFSTRPDGGSLTERMLITSGGQVEIGSIPSVTPALLSVRNNGTCIEYGHGNNNGRYEGTLGVFGSSGFSYIGFSTSCDYAANTFTTRGWKGNVINSNDQGDLIFAQATNANAGNQTLTERMRIKSNGKVGIGTENAQNAELAIKSGSNVDLELFSEASGTAWQSYNRTSSSWGYIRFIAGGGEQMRIHTNGNVGIGTTTVQNKFVVRGSGSGFNSTIQTSTASIISKELTDNAYHSILQLVAVRQSLTTGKNSQGYLGFSTIDDSNNEGQLDAGRIAIVNENGGARNSATALSFWTNPGGAQTTPATEKMRIDSSGRVGIGTDLPGTKLEIYGNTSSGGFGVYPALTIKNDNASGYSAIHFNQSTNQKARIEISNSAGSMGLYTTSGANGILINSSGRVGIGTTTTPLGMINIASNDSSIPTIVVSGASNGGSTTLQSWRYIQGSTSYKLDLAQQVSSGLVKYKFNTINDSTSYNNNLVLDRGNVGIGTDSPSGPFHVKVGTSTPLIVASSSYCNNVGIRTTTPTASLQVKGNVSYSYNNYTNVANTWINVINFSGYPAGLYQISIIKKTNASTYITAIVKWSATAGTVISTIASNQLAITFSGTQLQAISGVATGTLMSANLQCLVTNEDFCS